MEGWRVDPDLVVGILAGIDDEGVDLALAAVSMNELAFEGGAGLKVDGRTTLANAWNAFLDDRRLVPGKLIHVLSSSAQSVTDATVSIVTGDEQMAGDGRDAETYALAEWGIDSSDAYGNGMP